MLRQLLTLTLAAGLLGPLAASAQAPAAPATPAAPIPAPVPPAAKKHDHLSGKITAVDADKKTVTITQHKKSTTLTVAADAKIYKPGDKRREPTGTFADLTVDTPITARITGDKDAPTTKEIHIRKPKAAAPPVTPTVPATPAAPATP